MRKRSPSARQQCCQDTAVQVSPHCWMRCSISLSEVRHRRASTLQRRRRHGGLCCTTCEAKLRQRAYSICVRTNSPPIFHLSFMMTSRKTPSLSDMWSMSFMMTGCRRNSFSSISIRSRSLTFAIRTAHSIRRRHFIAGMRTAAVCLRRGRNNGRNA